MLDSCKMLQSSLKHSIRFCGIFPSLKHNFIAYRFSKVSLRPDCIFKIHQLWQSGFSRVYSNCCCSCSFEREIIKIGQSSHKIYSNKILNFQESTWILNACTKIVWKLIEGALYYIHTPTGAYIHIYILIFLSLFLWLCLCLSLSLSLSLSHNHCLCQSVCLSVSLSIYMYINITFS